MSQNLSSAAVVIGALRVKKVVSATSLNNYIWAKSFNQVENYSIAILSLAVICTDKPD